jgi:hypothetical protein
MSLLKHRAKHRSTVIRSAGGWSAPDVLSRHGRTVTPGPVARHVACHLVACGDTVHVIGASGCDLGERTVLAVWDHVADAIGDLVLKVEDAEGNEGIVFGADAVVTAEAPHPPKAAA